MALRITLTKLISQKVSAVLNIPNRTFSGWEKTVSIRDSFSNQQPMTKRSANKVFNMYTVFGEKPWDDF